MRTTKSFAWFIELVFIGAVASAAPSPLRLSPCTFGGAAARCGTFDVRESPKSSRMLALKVVVVPATDHNISPIFVFSGGPGVPTLPGAEFFVKTVPAERRLHDELFIDTRGVGESSPLTCPAAMKSHERELVEQELLPAAFVADCRREVEKRADPTRYTYDYVADDVEALRQALGYGPMDVIGLSAGTREALTYLAAYPKSVRSMILYGPLPPQNLMPFEYPRDTEAAFDRLVADCRADAQCSTTYPKFEEETDAVLAWLATHPPTIEHGGYRIPFTRGGFAEFLRSTMYTAEGQALVPLIVHLAAQGKWDDFAQRYIDYRKRWYEDAAIFLAISCPMDVRYIDPNAIAAASADTITGPYRAQRQIAACEKWTPGRAPRVKVGPSTAPVLVITGDLDPVTPPRWAQVVAKDLQNARVIVVNNTGHIDLNECTDSLELAFFDSGSFTKLDDTCASRSKRPPFATKLP